MFRSLSIRGFRGFEDLKIEGLDRFNLFLGRNNVGKTAILEALFLLAGPNNPDLPRRVNVFRGFEPSIMEPENVWGWLFYGKDTEREITLELESETHKRRTLRIRMGDDSDVRSVATERTRGSVAGEEARLRSEQPRAMMSTASKPTELLLSFRHETGQEASTKASVSPNGLEARLSKEVPFPESMYVIARIAYSSDNATKFSELQEVKREEEILPALQILEPRLRGLSVLVGGAGAVIHGDIGLERMIPVPLMGEGMGRLLTLLLAISASKNGLVMVDEIDSGFHYSVLEKVWSAVATLARATNVQLFATTHSWECLKAAHQSFSKAEPYDFRLHRLDLTEGKVTSTTYDDAMIATALSSGMELR